MSMLAPPKPLSKLLSQGSGDYIGHGNAGNNPALRVAVFSDAKVRKYSDANVAVLHFDGQGVAKLASYWRGLCDRQWFNLPSGHQSLFLQRASA